MTIEERLAGLRREMARRGIDAYIVPTEDFHGSEYVGAYFKVREYLSGFTGSAGTLLVMPGQAALWTDGRYFLQAKEQLDDSGIVLMRAGESGVPTLADYLKERLRERAVVGFDGRTVSSRFVKKLSEKLRDKQVSFAGGEDLANLVWADRPRMACEPVWELGVSCAGSTREEKIAVVRGKMAEQGADALLLSALDEIAWLLNLRGGDIQYTPVFLSYLLLRRTDALLFVQQEAVDSKLREKLCQAGVTLAPYEAVERELGRICAGQTVWLDDKKVSDRLAGSLPASARRLEMTSPVERLKAVKTPAEQRNMEQAHIKDGVAVTRFIRWVKENAGTEKITELRAAQKLEELRAAMDGYLGPSFSPIIAYGAHGAIVHYEPTPESDAVLLPKSFCLADTGGHYWQGTTDITRTIALGALTEEEKRMYTLALRGHLKLGAAVFLQGTGGQNLDVLARGPLWENGLDYRHGTGHGVGYLLNVHEGPQRFHWRSLPEVDNVPLEEGMVISNEPGLYIEGRFGIRHENLLLCCRAGESEYGQFLQFKTLTMVPFDRDAIEPSLLTEGELAQLNHYHQTVYNALAPHLTEEECAWLAEVTREIKRS